jgi:uncharacterized metal-binding protein YceD (DUF177 family)
MTQITNEFPRPVRLDTLGGARSLRIEAEPAERAALARRFGFAALDRLEADATLSRTGEIVMAKGRIVAEVTQSCVATGEPIPVHVDTAFTLRFAPEESAAAGEEEVELSEGDCDTVFYEGAAIDLGEAAAETLMLSLDPFPRSANADAALREAGVLSEGEAGPFAALKALKDKLG